MQNIPGKPIIEAVLYLDKEIIKLRVRSETGQSWNVDLKPDELARIAEKWKEIQEVIKR